MKRRVLQIIVILSSFLLIVINFYTIKTTSAVRAYINGESRYSKGQKDASRFLIIYLESPDPQFLESFAQELNVPLGDSLARVGLLNRVDPREIKAGFLQGKNHPDDLDNMIWLFDNFKNVSFMQEAIQVWKKGDFLIKKLFVLGDTVKQRTQRGQLTTTSRQGLINEINRVTTQLTKLEREFSDLMGSAARTINTYLFVFNFIMTMLIIGSAARYSSSMIKKLTLSQEALKAKNIDLLNINSEMDSFIYAVSHDLKSPVSNLEGLLTIYRKTATNVDTDQKDLLERMEHSVSIMRQTIAGIVDVIKVDQHHEEKKLQNDFQQLFQEILNENEVIFNLSEVEFVTDFKQPSLFFSRSSLKSIVYNLVSNSVKYRAPRRKLLIALSTFSDREKTVFEIKDNGLGMDLKQYGDKLFGMFKRFHNHVEGSGLGLYMIRRIVTKNGGSIAVESEVGQGSKFTIIL